MKNLFIGILAILSTIFGLEKLADSFDTTVKEKAIKSERQIAGNGWSQQGGKGGRPKGGNPKGGNSKA